MTDNSDVKTISALRRWLIDYEVFPDKYSLPGDPEVLGAQLFMEQTQLGWKIYCLHQVHAETIILHEGDDEAVACKIFIAVVKAGDYLMPNRAEVQDDLRKNCYRRRAYSLNGKRRAGAMVLEAVNPKGWLVYYWDGFLAWDTQRFMGERAACEYLFAEVKIRSELSKFAEAFRKFKMKFCSFFSVPP